MATLSKPKARVNHIPTEKERQKSFEGNGFVFSDKIEDWMIGRSLAAKKSKDLF
jgi:hypothetical protein